ncbi:MAG: hypothetical protein KJO07_05410 [Deltaproteobacteria bacterium]|nr:hypothetical protein [Deltaproteobacteria bacterium]
MNKWLVWIAGLFGATRMAKATRRASRSNGDDWIVSYRFEDHRGSEFRGELSTGIDATHDALGNDGRCMALYKGDNAIDVVYVARWPSIHVAVRKPID